MTERNAIRTFDGWEEVDKDKQIKYFAEHPICFICGRPLREGEFRKRITHKRPYRHCHCAILHEICIDKF